MPWHTRKDTHSCFSAYPSVRVFQTDLSFAKKTYTHKASTEAEDSLELRLGVDVSTEEAVPHVTGDILGEALIAVQFSHVCHRVRWRNKSRIGR